MPLGPEFNPATAIGALNRPEVSPRFLKLFFLMKDCLIHYIHCIAYQEQTYHENYLSLVVYIFTGYAILVKLLTYVLNFSGGEEIWCHHKANQI